MLGKDYYVFRVLTSNNGSPTTGEFNRVVKLLDDYNAFIMPGIHPVNAPDDNGIMREFKADVRRREPAPILPEFNL